MKKFLSAVTFLILVLAVTVTAQTPQDLRHTYGAPDSLGRYIVRPNIGMRVKISPNGRVSEMILKPLDSEDASDRATSMVMSSALTKEILEETVPSNKRGKLQQKGGFAFGCTSTDFESYEFVIVSTITRCAAQGGGIYSASAHWK